VRDDFFTRRAPSPEDYELLGLPWGASFDEVATRYRSLSKTLHPDTDTGDAERFTRVNVAFERIEAAEASGAGIPATAWWSASSATAPDVVAGPRASRWTIAGLAASAASLVALLGAIAAPAGGAVATGATTSPAPAAHFAARTAPTAATTPPLLDNTPVGGSASQSTPSTPATPATSSTPAAPACPSGSLTASLTLSAVQLQGPGDRWQTSISGGGQDGIGAPILVTAVDVHVVAPDGASVGTETASIDGGSEASVVPGGGIAFGTGGGSIVHSPGLPTVSYVTITWDWPVGSPYAACAHPVEVVSRTH
jgi:hypothetical protein